MKYIIGFIVGALVTALFFLNYLRGLQLPSNEKMVEPTAQMEGEEDNGFITFFKQFNEDSIYQMNHIRFPLEGIPARDSSYVESGGEFRWQNNNWTLHRPFNNMDGAFQQTFIPMGEDLMIENIKHVSGRYGMQRRFAKYDDGWYLIYYAAMNELAAAPVE